MTTRNRSGHSYSIWANSIEVTLNAAAAAGEGLFIRVKNANAITAIVAHNSTRPGEDQTFPAAFVTSGDKSAYYIASLAYGVTGITVTQASSSTMEAWADSVTGHDTGSPIDFSRAIVDDGYRIDHTQAANTTTDNTLVLVAIETSGQDIAAITNPAAGNREPWDAYGCDGINAVFATAGTQNLTFDLAAANSITGIIFGVKSAPAGGDVTIESIDDNTPAFDASTTLTTTNAGATQGSSTLTAGGVTQVPTAWSATSISFPFNGYPIGVAQDVELTVGAVTDTISVTPVAPTGWYAQPVLTSVASSGLIELDSPDVWEIGNQPVVDSPLITFDVDGTYSYDPLDPPLTGNGTDPSFHLRICSSGVGLDESRVIFLEPLANAPTFTSSAVTSATEDSVYTYNVTCSDTDAGDTLTITAPTLPAWLTLTDHGSRTATLTGTPLNANVGNNAVVLQVSDGTNTAQQSFTISVANTNDAPAGTDGSATINEDATKTFAASDFGFTDVDVGDTISAVRIDTLPSAGSLALSSVAVTAGQVILAANIGNLVFTPAANANGTPYATFTFSVRDQAGDYDATPNTFTINVTAVNDAPVAVDDTRSTAVNTPITFDPRANDTDQEGNTLTVTGVTQGTHGEVTFTDTSVTYTPDTDYTGADSFTYTISDGTATDTGTVSMTVTAASGRFWKMTASGLVPMTIWKMTESGLVAVS